MSRQKQVTDVSLVVKDSNMESENLSSLIRIYVSDSQKQTVQKMCYRYIIMCVITNKKLNKFNKHDCASKNYFSYYRLSELTLRLPCKQSGSRSASL